MATRLNNPVSRVAEIVTDNRYCARERDQITVTLYPNATIGFRAKHARKEYTLPLSHAYMAAVEAHVLDEKKKKMLEKKARRMGLSKK